MDLSKVTVRPIAADEEERYQQLLEHHHYLGAIPKIGQTVRYLALYEGEWVGGVELFGRVAEVRRTRQMDRLGGALPSFPRRRESTVDLNAK